MTKHSIELVKQIDLKQAIEYYTHQQPSRGKYLCPFHHDRHPSLTIKGGHWQCWSCGEHGDIISFVQKHFSIGFVEAVHRLADDFGIVLEEDAPSVDPQQKIWRQIERECRERDKAERQAYRRKLTDELDDLTSVYRALFHYGAPADVLQRYESELDALQYELDSIGGALHESALTAWEQSFMRELRRQGNKRDPELIRLITTPLGSED